MMDFTSFSHGQIKSKLWLCDKIEQFLPENSDITILGSWYNILGCMLFMRNEDKVHHVTGVDINNDAISIAEKIANYWYIEGKLQNVCMNANSYSIPSTKNAVVINCSPEHFTSSEWFSNIPDGVLTCVQSSNVTDPNDPWFITNPTPTYEVFMEKYPLSNVLFSGTLKIEYSHFSYERYMIIGNK